MTQTVVIHQPEFLPCLHLLYKCKQADIVIILDDVQFNRASLQHRAKIAQGDSWTWITIPFVHNHPQFINEVVISNLNSNVGWPQRHRDKIKQNYKRPINNLEATCYPALRALRWLYGTPSRGPRLIDFVLASQQLLWGAFDIRPKQVVLSSELKVEGAKGDKVLNLCKAVGATRYFSGRGGASYLDKAAFDASGIELAVSQYIPPKYREGQPDELGLSGLDAWLHLGADAKRVLYDKA